MVENLFLDRQRGNPSNTHLLGLENLNKHKQQHNLTDIWRKHNPHTRHFTYHNAGNTIHSRTDRIYIANSLKTKSSKIIPTPFSDHNSVAVTLQIIKKEPKRPGVWKLNTSILKHENFQKTFAEFWKEWQNQKNKYHNINDWWESGKHILNN